MGQEVVLGALEACVLWHAIEELRVLNLQVVDSLDVRHLKLVLHTEGE